MRYINFSTDLVKLMVFRDGQLKREKPKPALLKKQQEEYSKRIKFE